RLPRGPVPAGEPRRARVPRLERPPRRPAAGRVAAAGAGARRARRPRRPAALRRRRAHRGASGTLGAGRAPARFGNLLTLLRTALILRTKLLAFGAGFVYSRVATNDQEGNRRS